jgi:hypothetical protein
VPQHPAVVQAPPLPQEGQAVAGLAAVPLAYNPNKPQGMVQVQPAAGGYVYPQQPYPPQQQVYPQQGYPPIQPGYVDNRASLAPSSATPVSQLVSQTTGTTNVSELSTQGLVAGGTPTPAPAPIAEADESAAVYQQQLYQQQQQQQYYQQYYQAHGQIPGQAVTAPQPGYVSAQPVYGQPQPSHAVYENTAPPQPQPQHAVFYEAADGQPAPVAPVEVASPDAGVSPLTAATAHPPAHAEGHQPS